MKFEVMALGVLGKFIEDKEQGDLQSLGRCC